MIIPVQFNPIRRREQGQQQKLPTAVLAMLATTLGERLQLVGSHGNPHHVCVTKLGGGFHKLFFGTVQITSIRYGDGLAGRLPCVPFGPLLKAEYVGSNRFWRSSGCRRSNLEIPVTATK